VNSWATRRQNASEVLRIISSSPGDLQSAFSAMLESATRVCEAKFGTLFLHEDGIMRAVASLTLAV
jgi:hypothetical protein